MRLALVLAALVVASPAMAAEKRCMAHVHKGALPWDSDAPNAPMQPFTPQGGSGNPSDTDAEVAGIARQSDGVWVTRVHEFTWRRSDVDLYGNCRRELR